ncbi:MAG: RNA polymerase sigma factor [Bacteroidaceae bacterium]|jgi:DNA-directed RNA polymerase specialized sigma24 family protein
MDAQSFKETFLPCQGRLYRAALRLTGNKEEAADLVQETYLKFWECRHKLPKAENAEAYAVRTLCNLCLSRRRTAVPETCIPAVKDLPLADPSTPALILERLEEATSLRLNDQKGAECLSNQLPALTEKEGYKVDMAVQLKEKISFIFSKTEKLKNASKYRYRNNRIVYNQNGAETEFFWYVFLSVDEPEDTETKEQQ